MGLSPHLRRCGFRGDRSPRHRRDPRRPVDRWLRSLVLPAIPRRGRSPRAAARLRASGDPDALASAIEPVLAAGAAAADRATPGTYRPTMSRRPSSRRRTCGRVGRLVIASCGPATSPSSDGSVEAWTPRSACSRHRATRRSRPSRSSGAGHGSEGARAHADGRGLGGVRRWCGHADVLGRLCRLLAEAGTGHARSLASSLRREGADLAARGTSLVDAERSPLLATWREALERAAREFRAAAERRPRDLAFHMIHLMNNRLGVKPLEEAYFATLLATRAREGRMTSRPGACCRRAARPVSVARLVRPHVGLVDSASRCGWATVSPGRDRDAELDDVAGRSPTSRAEVVMFATRSSGGPSISSPRSPGSRPSSRRPSATRRWRSRPRNFVVASGDELGTPRSISTSSRAARRASWPTRCARWDARRAAPIRWVRGYSLTTGASASCPRS